MLALMVGCIAISMHYGNNDVSAISTGLGLTLIFPWVFTLSYLWSKADPLEMLVCDPKTDTYSRFSVLLLPLFVCLFFPTFLYMQIPTGSYWVVDHRLTSSNTFLVAIPFRQDICKVPRTIGITRFIAKKTKDGLPLTGYLETKLSLVLDENAIVSAASTRSKGALEVEQVILGILEKDFGESVGSRNLNELNQEIIAPGRGSTLVRSKISVLGLTYGGPIHVKDFYVQLGSG